MLGDTEQATVPIELNRDLCSHPFNAVGEAMRSSKIESESSHRHLYMKCEICDRNVDHSRYQVLSAVAGQSYNNMGGVIQIIKKTIKEKYCGGLF